MHSNVERHGVHPPGPSASKGVCVGAIERNVVAHNESVSGPDKEDSPSSQG